MRILVTTAVALLLLGGAACSDDSSDDEGATAASSTADGGGGGGGGSSSADDLDECAVLSVDEVAESTGHELGDPSPLPAGCQWPLTDGTAASHEWQWLPTESYESNRDSAEAAGFVVEPVSGLGTEAFRRNQVNTEGELIQTELWVTLDDEAFFVRSAGLEVSDDLVAAHEELADLLVERLS
jgi:hypothetical protein